ncbi:MAG: MarR family transcriptional regulator [Terriglobales bacterium]
MLLRELHKRGQGAPGELAATVGLTRGAVSKIIDKLEAKGSVQTKGKEGDNRFRVLFLTRSGLRSLPILARTADRNDESFFDCLRAREKIVLRELLVKIAEHNRIHDLPNRLRRSVMSKAVDNLTQAMKRAEKIRPRAGGFPYLAEVLRQAGVKRNVWSLPSCQSLFLTQEGPVVMQGTPLVNGAADVPVFDENALIQALRVDQAGESTFPEFLDASWRAGVIRYDVDLDARTVAYQGCNGEEYIEAYPVVSIG